jgi:hypothetical protein
MIIRFTQITTVISMKHCRVPSPFDMTLLNSKAKLSLAFFPLLLGNARLSHTGGINGQGSSQEQ